ncbi:MAG: phosphoribosylanthranilate isomerase [Oscillospiraceae bacterium]|nr:phosphoribosylanthranilate isomerase [Oscillospiraceae bacterium]
MKLKFCGIRRKEDIDYINIVKPDYIGFVFADSKRFISPDDVRCLIKKTNPEIKKAGVFVNESLSGIVNAVKTSGIDIIQLHGDEDADYINSLRNLTDCEIWKAVRVKKTEDILKSEKIGADMLLLDSFSEAQYGGTGKTSDWNIIKSSGISSPFFLAGGINENNIQEAISSVSPFGIDISGGIETNGYKDINKMKKIIDLIERND